MSLRESYLYGRWADWGSWRTAGGYEYQPMRHTEERNRGTVRNVGEHTDPTLSRVIALHSSGHDREATTDMVYVGLPPEVQRVVWLRHADSQLPIKDQENPQIGWGGICAVTKLSYKTVKKLYGVALDVLEAELLALHSRQLDEAA